MKKIAIMYECSFREFPYYLEGSPNDQQKMFELLTSRGYECVRMSDNAKYRSNVLRDGDTLDAWLQPRSRRTMYASYENFYRAVRALARTVEAGDAAFMHFSTHGTYSSNDRVHTDDAELQDQMIVMRDMSGRPAVVRDDIMRVAIMHIPCDTTVFFDCCHSATIGDIAGARAFVPTNARSEQNTANNSRTPAIKRALQSPVVARVIHRRNLTHFAQISDATPFTDAPPAQKNVLVIAGCADDSESYEIRIKKNGQNISYGLLTHYFTETYNEINKKTTAVPVQELMQRVATKIENTLKPTIYKQHPHIASNTTIDTITL